MRAPSLAALLSLAGATALPAQAKAEPVPLDARVLAALGRARPTLLDHLVRSRGGERALLVLAALHDEVPSDNRVLAQAIEELAKERFMGTYELAIRLMVMLELPRFPGRATLVREDTQRLLSHQCEDGGFSYTSGRGKMDLSNTQYGALGMRAAAALGQTIETARWKLLAQCAASAQENYGGFGYQSSSSPYASMTVAGIAILEIARQQLPKGPSTAGIEGRIARGWGWMDTHVREIGNSATGWTSYFHYGLERAAILSDKTTVGGKSWYELGALMFLKDQQPDGGWGSSNARGQRSTPIDTAFAVLFLRKKFKKSAEGPITLGGGTPVRGLTAQSTDEEIERAVTFDALRAKQAVPDLLAALASNVLAQRKAAIRALFKIAGDDFGYQPYLAPEKQVEALDRAAAWWRENRETRPGK